MYVAKMRIQNYRCFSNQLIECQPQINVLIGENNAGKSTVLRALDLVFRTDRARRLAADDFHRPVSLTTFSDPPEVTISVTLQSSVSDKPEDRAVVASWITRLEAPWEATLTYRFALPEADVLQFRIEASAITTPPWSVMWLALIVGIGYLAWAEVENRRHK